MIRSRSGAIRLLALAFSLGALVGGAATMLADMGSHPRGGEAGARVGFVERLSNEVGLTTEQKGAVATVLDRHEPVMDSLWQAHRAPFDSARKTFRRDIRAVLTPDQVVKYDAMVARRDSLHRSRDAKRGNR